MNGNQVSAWIASAGMWPLIVVLVPNVMFRRYGQATGKKRMASLFQAIAVFFVTTSAALVMEKELTDLYLFISVVIVGVVLYIFRSRVFPYCLKCVDCRKSLDSRTIYFMDDNLCSDCRSEYQAESGDEEEE